MTLHWKIVLNNKAIGLFKLLDMVNCLIAYYTLTFRVRSYIAPDNNIILEDVLEYSRRNKSLVSNKNQIKGK